MSVAHKKRLHLYTEALHVDNLPGSHQASKFVPRTSPAWSPRLPRILSPLPSRLKVLPNTSILIVIPRLKVLMSIVPWHGMALHYKSPQSNYETITSLKAEEKVYLELPVGVPGLEADLYVLAL